MERGSSGGGSGRGCSESHVMLFRPCDETIRGSSRLLSEEDYEATVSGRFRVRVVGSQANRESGRFKQGPQLIREVHVDLDRMFILLNEIAIAPPVAADLGNDALRKRINFNQPAAEGILRAIRATAAFAWLTPRLGKFAAFVASPIRQPVVLVAGRDFAVQEQLTTRLK